MNRMYKIIIITVFCLFIAFIDIKTYRIPNYLLALLFIIITILDWKKPLMFERFIATSIVLILFSAIWYFSKGIGLGDVKYAALLAYVLEPVKVIPAFVFTALFAIIIYTMGILIFHWSKTTKIPFAPFLSAGAIMSLGLAV